MAEKQGGASMNINKSLIISAVVYLFLLAACENSGPEDQIPGAIVNETINLTNQQYLSLQFVGGHADINGGVRGIIVYHAPNNEYRAFERNCSYDPLNTCARVEVDGSGLFLVDSCCSSTFNFDGFPTGGPAGLPLRLYNTILQGNILTITN